MKLRCILSNQCFVHSSSFGMNRFGGCYGEIIWKMGNHAISVRTNKTNSL